MMAAPVSCTTLSDWWSQIQPMAAAVTGLSMPRAETAAGASRVRPANQR